ncbi:MAG: Nif11-like leader peptide family natural product precursor [Coriobacteriia bacterium]|nr:Nif11-like leader peptide family natural product precursor [Coriobacteriia bacterium]
MKNTKQFLEDLQQDKDLAAALEALAPELEEKYAQVEDAAAAQLEAIVSFAKEHGYEVDPEELAMDAAANREVDDANLADIAGGGRGWCALNYTCLVTFNSCVVSNECRSTSECKDRAW